MIIGCGVTMRGRTIAVIRHRRRSLWRTGSDGWPSGTEGDAVCPHSGPDTAADSNKLVSLLLEPASHGEGEHIVDQPSAFFLR